MAKISARGCHKVAAFRVDGDDNREGETVYEKFVLRSDGMILRGTGRTVHSTDGYRGWTNSPSLKQWRKFREDFPADERTERLERMLVKMFGADRVKASR